MTRPIRTTADERDVFRALGHPIRRRFVGALAKRPRGFNELVRLAQRSDATVAAHLRTLRQAGLVTTRRRGRRVEYHARLDPLSEGVGWMIDQMDTNAAAAEAGANAPAVATR